MLRIEELYKHYGGIHALESVSFTLESGTVLGIAGDNGAGKSTLMKCITGAETPNGGRILFDGAPLPPGNPHASRLAGIEMIYQNLNLCPQQDVVANIFLGREKTIAPAGWNLPFLDLRIMKKEAAALIRDINADIPLHKKTGSLSGGQQQAVAIARALLHRPKLLIMDEPTAALGVRESAKVLDLIRSLKKQGLAVILISHRLSDLFEVADRIILMRHAKVQEDSPTKTMNLSDLTKKILCS